MNENKVWLITGCSTGFGRELAKYVGSQGQRVVATVRKESQVAEIEALAPGKIKAILMDVQHIDQIDAGVAAAAKEFGRVDVLVNNAGYGEIGPIEEVDEAASQRQMDINVHGPLRLLRAVLPIMRAQKSGHIINITSIAGLRGNAGLGVYNASKFALEGIGEALAHEVNHLGIHVTNVEPGPFRTEWAGASAAYHDDMHEDYKASAGAMLSMLHGKAGNQPGDPVKGAKAIYELSTLAKPPVHMPLGNLAFEAALDKLETMKAEILAFEHVGRRTDFE